MAWRPEDGLVDRSLRGRTRALIGGLDGRAPREYAHQAATGTLEKTESVCLKY